MNAPAPTQRYDIYRLIHKGLRAFLVDTLTAAGSMDSADDADVEAVLGRVRGLLAFCRSHLGHEDRHLHTAMEAREPGSTAQAALDHADHAHLFDELEAAIAAVEGSRGDGRAAAAHALYRRLAVFVGENLVHMDHEESHNNAVLWRHYRDDELMAIEAAIVGSQPPQDKGLTARWIGAAVTPSERAAFLAAVRGAVPPEAFRAILDGIEAHLRPTDRAKLAQALAAPTLAA